MLEILKLILSRISKNFYGKNHMLGECLRSETRTFGFVHAWSWFGWNGTRTNSSFISSLSSLPFRYIIFSRPTGHEQRILSASLSSLRFGGVARDGRAVYVGDEGRLRVGRDIAGGVRTPRVEDRVRVRPQVPFGHIFPTRSLQHLTARLKPAEKITRSNDLVLFANFTRLVVIPTFLKRTPAKMLTMSFDETSTSNSTRPLPIQPAAVHKARNHAEVQNDESFLPVCHYKFRLRIFEPFESIQRHRREQNATPIRSKSCFFWTQPQVQLHRTVSGKQKLGQLSEGSRAFVTESFPVRQSTPPSKTGDANWTRPAGISRKGRQMKCDMRYSRFICTHCSRRDICL